MVVIDLWPSQQQYRGAVQHLLLTTARLGGLATPGRAPGTVTPAREWGGTVPCLFRQGPEDSEKLPSLAIGLPLGEDCTSGHMSWSRVPGPDNFTIFEDTPQVMPKCQSSVHPSGTPVSAPILSDHLAVSKMTAWRRPSRLRIPGRR